MKTVAVVGTGLIALEHAKVIKSLGHKPILVSRTSERAEQTALSSGFDCIGGGVSGYKKAGHSLDSVVIAVPVQASYDTTMEYLRAGARSFFLEKPGALTLQDLSVLNGHMREANARAFVAYNRRFYASTRKLMELMLQDGGATSMTFDFTEWSHVIEALIDTDIRVKNNLVMCNSSHVIDMAFFLCGHPAQITSYGNGSLPWHPSRSRFSGAGITDSDVLFSYHANWESGGRWGVEVCTRAGKYILRPLEKLQFMPKGKVDIQELQIDDAYDKQYKPGFFLQMKSFLLAENTASNEARKGLCSLEEHVINAEIYAKIAGYH